MSGYVKPLFRNLKVFSFTQDIKEGNVFQFFWEALVGGATSTVKNFSRNQFGTLIPFTGDASGSTTMDILATLGNLFRNAFIRAYLPRLESGPVTMENFQFEAPSFSEALSAANNETQ